MTITWGQIIDNKDSEDFIGRTKELTTFKTEIKGNPLKYLIFFISGQGGVGKTTLLKQYKLIAEEEGFYISDCDEKQNTIPEILHRFMKQLEQQGIVLKEFSKTISRFQELKTEIECDPQAPQGFASFLGQNIAKAGLVLASEVPYIRTGINLIDQDSIIQQAGEWANYLAQKLSNKHDEIALVKNPSAILSSIFFKELSDAAENNKFLLCFDNYEITSEHLAPWLTRIRDFDPSSNIRLVIASRIPPGPTWEPLTSILAHIKLDIFSIEEANQYLNSVGILDESRRNEIIEFSNRLPVLMSWLAFPSSNTPDPELPSADIVDRFLRWVTEPNLKEFALEASIPQYFNLDILKSIFSNTEAINLQKGFEWLIEQPYVFEKKYGWTYHEIVRRLMVNYSKCKSLNRFQSIHQLIMCYYQEKIDGLNIKTSKKWQNQHWQEYTIELMYHKLLHAPESNWDWTLNLFVQALKYNPKFAQNIIDMLNQPTNLDCLSTNQVDIILFISKFNLLSENDEDLFDLFKYVYNISELDEKNKSHILFLMGKEKIGVDNESALKYVNQAINLDSKNYLAINARGKIFYHKREYKKALDDFERSLKIKKSSEAYHYRLASLGEMGEYEQVVEIIGDEVEINCPHCLSIRGSIYFEQNNLEKALHDVNKCLEISPDYLVAKMRRGEIYTKLREYDLAITDFEQVMEGHEEFIHESLKNIGMVFFAQEKYEESINKILEALKIYPDCGHCWDSLLLIFEKLYSMDEVITKFSKNNFPFINFSLMTYIRRAQTLLNRGYYQAYTELELGTIIDPTLDLEKHINLNELGLLLGRNEQYEAAIICYEKQKALSDYIKNYNIAISFALWKGYQEATKYINKAEETLIELKQKDQKYEGIYKYGLAGIASVRGQKSLAIDLVREAYSLDPTIANFLNTDPAWNLLRNEQDFQKVISSLKIINE